MGGNTMSLFYCRINNLLQFPSGFDLALHIGKNTSAALSIPALSGEKFTVPYVVRATDKALDYQLPATPGNHVGQ
jgi:hypothetical protein